MSSTPGSSAPKSLVRRVLQGLNRPEVAVLLESDNLLVQTPVADEVWDPGSEQTVTWWVVGQAGDVVDIELVTIEGTQARTAAVLAGGVETNDRRATVTVPEVAPGSYRVLVTSAQGMLDAYSQPITVTA
ncbi:GPI anchored serine-threonine rich family protein [Streptomyces sp. NBC_00435]|uniref:Ser-Thr-rich GPI-anchored membrane family protein n=1 Tax=Streptomyces sp. NBC_00435 TaxID=2903649 RepID=UPI002E1AC52F